MNNQNSGKDHAGITAKVYESGSSIVLTVPKHVVKVEDITPGDILTLNIVKITPGEPDSA